MQTIVKSRLSPATGLQSKHLQICWFLQLIAFSGLLIGCHTSLRPEATGTKLKSTSFHPDQTFQSTGHGDSPESAFENALEALWSQVVLDRTLTSGQIPSAFRPHFGTLQHLPIDILPTDQKESAELEPIVGPGTKAPAHTVTIESQPSQWAPTIVELAASAAKTTDAHTLPNPLLELTEQYHRGRTINAQCDWLAHQKIAPPQNISSNQSNDGVAAAETIDAQQDPSANAANPFQCQTRVDLESIDTQIQTILAQIEIKPQSPRALACGAEFERAKFIAVHEGKPLSALPIKNAEPASNPIHLLSDENGVIEITQPDWTQPLSVTVDTQVFTSVGLTLEPPKPHALQCIKTAPIGPTIAFIPFALGNVTGMEDHLVQALSDLLKTEPLQIRTLGQLEADRIIGYADRHAALPKHLLKRFARRHPNVDSLIFVRTMGSYTKRSGESFERNEGSIHFSIYNLWTSELLEQRIANLRLPTESDQSAPKKLLSEAAKYISKDVLKLYASQHKSAHQSLQ